MTVKRKKQPAVAAPKPEGRPTKFDKRYIEEARRLAMLGATDAEMAAFWDVAESTLYLWKREHPQFSEALKAGKLHADMTVSESLFKRANGFTHEAVKILQYEGQPVIVPYTEKYPPDTTAAIFWLKNRQRDKWRDKTDHEHSGTVSLAQLIAETPDKPKK